jgi:uncharacterized membrane protein YjgN (DUF898 family)
MKKSKNSLTHFVVILLLFCLLELAVLEITHYHPAVSNSSLDEECNICSLLKLCAYYIATCAAIILSIFSILLVLPLLTYSYRFLSLASSKSRASPPHFSLSF